jgi:hypothetical protein
MLPFPFSLFADVDGISLIDDQQFLFPMLTVFLLDFADADDTSTILENIFVGQNQRSMLPFSHFSNADGTSAIDDYRCYVGIFPFIFH